MPIASADDVELAMEALGTTWAADFIDPETDKPVAQQLRAIPAAQFIDG
ncbi:MAG: hypothetical protein OSA98_16090 [Rubripirellula sp.]|nr:hypothetical protein [Rubripirellula sp.]